MGLWRDGLVKVDERTRTATAVSVPLEVERAALLAYALRPFRAFARTGHHPLPYP
jgi:hypothetical protein